MPASWSRALTRHSGAFWSGLESVRRGHLLVMVAVSALAVALDGLAFAMLFLAMGRVLSWAIAGVDPNIALPAANRVQPVAHGLDVVQDRARDELRDDRGEDAGGQDDRTDESRVVPRNGHQQHDHDQRHEHRSDRDRNGQGKLAGERAGHRADRRGEAQRQAGPRSFVHGWKR